MTDADRQDMLCRTCLFYRAPKPTEGSVGQCRRLPPQMLPVTFVSYSGEGQTRTHTEERDANWPLVGEEEWCGEWKGNRGGAT